MITAADLFREAQALLSTTSAGEARCRSAMSRSYYAAYHAVLKIALTRGFIRKNYPRVGTHEALLEFLASTRDPDLASLHDDLRTLKMRRVLADYMLHKSIVVRDVQDVVEMAEALMENL